MLVPLCFLLKKNFVLTKSIIVWIDSPWIVQFRGSVGCWMNWRATGCILFITNYSEYVRVEEKWKRALGSGIFKHVNTHEMDKSCACCFFNRNYQKQAMQLRWKYTALEAKEKEEQKKINQFSLLLCKLLMFELFLFEISLFCCVFSEPKWKSCQTTLLAGGRILNSMRLQARKIQTILFLLKIWSCFATKQATKRKQ